MKEKVAAWILLAVIFGFVGVNTYILNTSIEKIIYAVNEVSVDEPEAHQKITDIYNGFKDKEKYISLTVNHEDLTNIEECFSEMIGYLSVGDTEGAEVIKYRLVDSLEHLRRLSGINIEAVI